MKKIIISALTAVSLFSSSLPTIDKSTQNNLISASTGALVGYVVYTYVPIKDKELKTLLTTTITAVTVVGTKEYLDNRRDK